MRRPAHHTRHAAAIATGVCARAGVVRPSRRRGTAALELAFILPVLIVLVLVSVDLGRGTQYDVVLSNAAREGAAYGATHRETVRTHDAWEAEIRRRVQGEAAYLPEFDSDQLDVAVEIIAQTDGSRRIEVEAAYPFEMILDVPAYSRTIVLRRRAAMQEYR